MPSITIRNLPQDLHTRLKKQAQRNRRSLHQEVIAELAAGLDSASAAERLASARKRMKLASVEIDQIRSRMNGLMTTGEIDAAIKEGRS
jgi:plasmid stability protein